MPKTLDAPITAYRIGDPRGEYDIYSGAGSRDYPGRWNAAGQAMIYASEHYSTALLEKLIYTGELPPNQHFIEISIPAGVSCETVTADGLSGWSDSNCAVSRAFGAAWFEEARSAILIVPSVVARLDRNILINPGHPEARRIKPGEEQPVPWDERLFKDRG